MIVKAIPTNVVTGFLGVGKTSFIKALFAEKPKGETWAVLVNEFGEIGIDANLLADNSGEIAIQEVPGGCMCCASGLPMQVALNQLITKAKPDRLLIEPTGLGHPREVLEVLQQAHYQNVIALKATVCLVDGRNIADKQYRYHPTFKQQLDVADIILASKADKYDNNTLSELDNFIHRAVHGNLKPLAADAPQLCYPISTLDCANGTATDIANTILPLLDGAVKPAVPRSERELSHLIRGEHPLGGDLFSTEIAEVEYEFDSRGICFKARETDGIHCYGWVVEPKIEFSFSKVMAQFRKMDVLRLKGVLITDEGIASVNMVDGELTIQELDEVMESKIELITDSEFSTSEFEQQLLAMVA